MSDLYKTDFEDVGCGGHVREVSMAWRVLKGGLALYVDTGPQGDRLSGMQLELCWQLISARNGRECGISNDKSTDFLVYSKEQIRKASDRAMFAKTARTVEGPTRRLGYMSRRRQVTTSPRTESPKCSNLGRGRLVSRDVREWNSLFVVGTGIVGMVFKYVVWAGIKAAVGKDPCSDVVVVDVW